MQPELLGDDTCGQRTCRLCRPEPFTLSEASRFVELTLNLLQHLLHFGQVGNHVPHEYFTSHTVVFVHGVERFVRLSLGHGVGLGHGELKNTHQLTLRKVLQVEQLIVQTFVA